MDDREKDLSAFGHCLVGACDDCPMSDGVEAACFEYKQCSVSIPFSLGKRIEAMLKEAQEDG